MIHLNEYLVNTIFSSVFLFFYVTMFGNEKSTQLGQQPIHNAKNYYTRMRNLVTSMRMENIRTSLSKRYSKLKKGPQFQLGYT